jgi:hypothetical protein
VALAVAVVALDKLAKMRQVLLKVATVETVYQVTLVEAQLLVRAAAAVAQTRAEHQESEAQAAVETLA